MICIVIVNWNGYKDTVECIKSINKLNHDNYAVVVVDNASADDSVRVLSEISTIVDDGFNCNTLKSKEIYLIASNNNNGFSGGNNIGTKFGLGFSNVDKFWYLNNDTEVDVNALTEMELKIDDKKINYGIVGSTLVEMYDKKSIQSIGNIFNKYTTIIKPLHSSLDKNELPDIDYVENNISYVVGASMLIKRDTVLKIGLQHEGYFLYFEELDICNSIEKERLGRIGWASKSLVYHKEGGSIGSSAKKRPSNKSISYISRSLILYYWRWHKLLIPVALMRIFYNIGRNIFRGDMDGAKYTFLGLMSVKKNAREIKF